MNDHPRADSLLFPNPEEVLDYSIERQVQKHLDTAGPALIAGVDEAGRGPIAGPVVAAAVILDPQKLPDGIDDSKKLTARSRDQLFEVIVTTAQTAWASIPAADIDRMNIRQATLLAMTRAANALPSPADHVLIDGKDVPSALAARGTALVKGDARCLSVAAASIVAKVVRDRMMKRLHEEFPIYGFDRHFGYGTRQHSEALAKFGPIRAHRRSFSPVRQMLSDED